MTYSFQLTEIVNLIIIIAKIDGYDVRLALDTGASNTIIDLTALMIAGYHKNNIQETVELETAKGSIDADIYTIQEIQALGITQNNFKVCSYDFLINGVLTEIDGVLGIDFFKNKKICIDFSKFEITVS
jgi:hypothetical protein